MKKIIVIISIFCIVSSVVYGQLKEQQKPIDIKSEIIKPNSNSMLGLSFIDLSKLSMSHSYSLSYYSIGGKGISQGLYLNTIHYQISNPLSLNLQWGIQNFPYNSLANNHPLFQDGFVFTGASLKYKPSENFMLKLQYNVQPTIGTYRNHYHNYFWDDEE